MVSLKDLPIEILHLILGYTSSSTRYALILTCQQLCKIVQPWLYHTVDLDVTDGIVASTKQAPIVGFILSLLEKHRQSLACSVRYLTIRGDKPLTLPIQFTQEQLHQWVQYTQYSAGTQSRWSTQLRKRGTDAIIAALISSFENLRVLHLGYDIWSDSEYLGPILRNLSNLQHIEFYPDPDPPLERTVPDIFRTVDGPVSYDTTLLHSLLFLRKIESISCVAAEPANGCIFVLPHWSDQSPCDSLSRLVFKRSELRPLTLGKILGVTPQLRQLEYDNWIDAHSPDKMSQYFECEQMDAALQPVRSKLERLKIRVEFFTHYAIDIGWGYDWGIRGTMRSLAQFPRLTHLEIPFVILMGWGPVTNEKTDFSKILPRSLKSLNLKSSHLDCFESYTWAPEDIYSHVHAYVKDRDMHAPDLEHLQLWINKRFLRSNTLDSSAFQEYLKLQNACFEANITLANDS